MIVCCYIMAQSTTSTAAAPPSLTGQELTDTLSLLVSLCLHAWPALNHAISQSWGSISGTEAKDKRDWLAGAVSELITPSLEVDRSTGRILKTGKSQLDDVGDLEEVLLQVMSDEFEVVVEDGSVEEAARRIWTGRRRILGGDLTEVQELHRRWKESGGNLGKGAVFQRGEDDEGRETDWDDDESSKDDEGEWKGFPDKDGDAQMNEAPALIDIKKEKPPPEIDDDGFTKVVRKKR